MHRPDVICFLETKSDSATDALKFLRHFGFDKDYQILSQGMAGGLWLFWRSSTVSLDILSSSSQFIHCSISQQQVSCMTTFVYVQPPVATKDLFWFELENLSKGISRS
ncbi:hypothetical protein SLA2020_352650 [Shorea laevis]